MEKLDTTRQSVTYKGFQSWTEKSNCAKSFLYKFNGFWQHQQKTSSMSAAEAMVTLKSRCLLWKKKVNKKWLKFHDDPYVFNISFMLYADFALIIIISRWAVQKKDESNEEWVKW